MTSTLPEDTLHADSVMHLSARLEALVTRIASLVAVRRSRLHEATVDHRFRGVYLSEGDVDRLLVHDDAPTPVDDGAVRAVESAVDDAASIGHPTRLRRLVDMFGLTEFDLDAVLTVLAPDVDPRFEGLYGYLHDDVTRRRATVGLVLEVAGRSQMDGWARGRLSPGGALVANGLIEILESERPFLTRGLRVPDRVCAFLLGDDSPDPYLAPYLVEPVPAALPGVDEAVNALSVGARLVYIHEQSGASGSSVACAAYSTLGIRTIELDARTVPPDADVEKLLAALVREVLLRDAGLSVTHVDVLAGGHPALLRAITTLPVVTTLVGPSAWDPDHAQPVPYSVRATPATPEDSLELLRAALGDQWPDGLDWLESGSRLRPIQAVRAANLAALRAAAGGRAVVADDVIEGTRQQNGTGLERLARRVTPQATWDELVVGPQVEAALRQLVSRMRYRSTVLDDWGLSTTAGRRRGVTAIFSGPPGTGKTLSAEVVAADLGLDLYVIDLAMVIDKYIGETEKNLDRIFSEAEQVNGVLFFDEADAIFGKRSEVKDANDRYANVEVAYLLQRIEMFDGIAVLATNLKANLDEAFMRRLDLAADFPSPNAVQRLRLWQQMMAPVPQSDDIDLEYLSRVFEISGGYIRNIVIAAAYLAAHDGTEIAMRHLVRATAQEYRKLGRLITGAEFGPHLDMANGEP